MLIAEDDSISRRILEAVPVKWGYEVVSVVDGTEAWEKLLWDLYQELAFEYQEKFFQTMDPLSHILQPSREIVS
jgi:CheY-like chemotaxis protein